MNAQDLKPFTFHCPFRQCIWKSEKMCGWDRFKLPNDSLALARNKQRKAKALEKKKKKEIILTFYVKNNFFREELSWLKQVIYLFISWWNWYYVNLEDSWGFFTPFFFFQKRKITSVICSALDLSVFKVSLMCVVIEHDKSLYSTSFCTSCEALHVFYLRYSLVLIKITLNLKGRLLLIYTLLWIILSVKYHISFGKLHV